MSELIIFQRDELYEKVWSKPMSVLCKEFNLSDNGLKKICKKFNIPTPYLGYWQKLSNHKNPKKPKLPKLKKNGLEEVRFMKSDQIKDDTEIEEPWGSLITKEKGQNQEIVVPLRFHSYHKILKSMKNEYDGYNNSFYHQTGEKDNFLYVSKSNLLRTKRILNTIILSLESRGYETKYDRYVTTTICNYKFKLRLSERQKKDVLVLHYKSSSQYSWRVIQDTSTKPLETRINEFIIKLIKLSYEEHQQKSKWIQREKEYEIERQEQELKNQRIREEELRKSKFLQFNNDLVKYEQLNHTIEKIQEYINSITDKIEEENISKWNLWAEQYANSFNPFSNLEHYMNINEGEL
jgi:hypothetical protein